MNLKSREWDISYVNRDNFVYYPHEEVIRFTSKYIRKRIGFDEFEDRALLGAANPRGIDLGCGIGRHVKFMHEYGLEGYGLDLSQVAIDTAKDLLARQGLEMLSERLTCGSLTEMPYPDDFFEFGLSHGVFDSMPFAVARLAMAETARCLKRGGLVYIDLISGDDHRHFPEFNAEEVVETAHEQGTIQSYFNWSKINVLIDSLFCVREATLIRKSSVAGPGYHSRYHLVLENLVGGA